MADKYVIAWADDNITAINPDTRRQLRILSKSRANKILDVYAHDFGIYHAYEEFMPESKPRKVKGSLRTHRETKWITKTFERNFAKVYDSISNRSFLSVFPSRDEAAINAIKEQNQLEDALLADIDFCFKQVNGQLLYFMNEKSGMIIPKLTSYSSNESLSIDSKNILYNGKRIASFDKISNVFEVNAENFSRAFRQKNKLRYKKNKEFFG